MEATHLGHLAQFLRQVIAELADPEEGREVQSV